MNTLKFYSLSTCIWCRKTRTYLQENNIKFQEVVVDQLKADDKTKALQEIALVNPAKSFPTLIVDKDHFVIGYKPDQFKDVFIK